MNSHSALCYAAARSPDVDGAEPAAGHCATCGAAIELGVPVSRIETPTTSDHAMLFRYRGDHVCVPCAWMFGLGKGRPGNFIATPARMEYVVISVESVVEDKRPWRDVLRDLYQIPHDTQVTGVMTTDVKPRLWHRARLTTVGNFGLYLHAPDYDVSEWRHFSLASCLVLMDVVMDVLRAGFSKTSCVFGLPGDYARFSRHLEQAMAWERELSAHRRHPHFLPAVIAAGVTKEDKRDVKNIRTGGEPDAGAAARDRDHQTQPGLF
jgi:hypothetical protein